MKSTGTFSQHVRAIEDLERQLAEAKTILSDLPDHSDLDAAVFEANALRRQLTEAQGKLKALIGLYIKHDTKGHYKDDRACAACQRDAILKGE